MATAMPTVTFLNADKATDPIPVPLWSIVTWIDHLGREQAVYVSDDKCISYHGPFWINGHKREPPPLYPLRRKTAVLAKLDTGMHTTRPMHRKRKTVVLPRNVFVFMLIAIYVFLGLWLWEVL